MACCPYSNETATSEILKFYGGVYEATFRDPKVFRGREDFMKQLSKIVKFYLWVMRRGGGGSTFAETNENWVRDFRFVSDRVGHGH